MNWKLRLKNKTTLVTLLTAAVALVYQILGALGVVPGVSEEGVVSAIGIVVNVLCMLGIVVDPTTAGVTDSARAMEYDAPKEDEEWTSNS